MFFFSFGGGKKGALGFYFFHKKLIANVEHCSQEEFLSLLGKPKRGTF